MLLAGLHIVTSGSLSKKNVSFDIKFLIVNTVIFAHLFLLGSLDEVEEYNEVFPPSAVHCLSGRNYAVYPLACGEWCYHCAFPSIQGPAWAYRGAVGNHFLSSLFRLFFPSVASGCRDGFPCFVVCTEHSYHGMHQVCKASWRYLPACSPFFFSNPID